jgi:hypothetical protein
MARKHEPLELVDSSGLTDDDWAKIYFDEEAEAKAQGLPCILAPRPLSREEWEKKCCPKVPEAPP